MDHPFFHCPERKCEYDICWKCGIKSQNADATGVTNTGVEEETKEQKKSPVVTYQDDGEEIEEAEVAEDIEKGEKDYCYYFIVDRSGSMRSRMDITIQSLKLFMQSLPQGCKFNIVSFGSEFGFMFENSNGPPEYSDQRLNDSRQQIDKFEADMGGT